MSAFSPSNVPPQIWHVVFGPASPVQGGLAEAMQRRAGMSRSSAPVIAPSDFAVV